jgi:hypothetical protein
VSTETRVPGKGGRHLSWFGPVLLALPFIFALIFAALRWGELLKNLVHVAIKMAVIS